MGVPLNRIPDIRRLYGLDPNGTSTINFDVDPQVEPSGMLALSVKRACGAWFLFMHGWQHKRDIYSYIASF